MPEPRLGARARLSTVLGGLLAINLLVGAAAVLSLRSQVATARLVAHTHEVRTDVQELRAILSGAESAQRGFLLSGNPVFLVHLRGAETASQRMVRALGVLTADNAQQQARLALLRQLIQRRVARAEYVVAVRTQRGLEAAAREVAAGQGVRLQDSIAAVLDGMEHQEIALLEPRLAAADAGATRATAIVLVGALLAVLIVLGGGVFIVRAARARALSEERLAGVIGVLAEGVVVQDGAGRVIECNDAAVRILGSTRERVMRLHEPDAPWPAIHEDGTPYPKDQHPAFLTLRSGTPTANVVMGIRRPDLATRWLLINAKPLLGPRGEVTGVVSSFSDITRRREAEQALSTARDAAEHANRVKTEFLANMSHELRTPLNSVIGFAAILIKTRQETLDPEALDFLERIHDNGRHLLGLINSVLDLAKIEAGKQELVIAPVALDGLIADVLAQFKPQVHERPIALVADVPPGLAPLETDAVKFKQVLINLVGNALKFTEKGRIVVRVVAEEGRPRAVEVADTGIGIPPERQAAVFEAFQQADNTTARRYGGTGLGLTITRSLLERMGYTIDLESTVGAGSTFRIDLEPHPDLRAGAGRISGGGRLVLIIDDDENARILLSEQIRSAGYRVVTAPSGAAGLRLAREVAPALITLDMLMPGMDGIEVLTALQREPATRDIPVVVVSIVGTEHRGRLPGAVDIIDKPVSREALEAVLKRHMAAHSENGTVEEDVGPALRRAISSH